LQRWETRVISIGSLEREEATQTALNRDKNKKKKKRKKKNEIQGSTMRSQKENPHARFNRKEGEINKKKKKN
jgi:hypothetical protein